MNECICDYCGAHGALRQVIPGQGVKWVCDDCHLRMTGLFFVGQTMNGQTLPPAQCPRGHPGPVTQPWMYGWCQCPTCTAAAGLTVPPVVATDAANHEPVQLRLL